MAEIKCPKCGEVIKLDKSDYDTLLNEVEKDEIARRVSQREKELSETFTAKKELEIQKAIADMKIELTKKEAEILNLKNEADASKKDASLKIAELEAQHKKEIEQREEDIERWRNYRMGDSTKDLGENLEQYCHDEFDEIRADAYPHAYFEKDNEVVEGGKGDFIFRDYSEDGVELCSILFDMKTEKDTTETKQKNEHFFKKLDEDRRKKNCEYAVLVSTLESDSKLYAKGIVDVSHRYEKMFVVRPQFFTAIIGLIRNMALNSYSYKKQVVDYQNEHLDIANFEENVRLVAQKIQADYEKANAYYDDVDKMIDGMIKKLEDFRNAFRISAGHISAAVNQLDNLSIKKLTKDNPTMREKFDSLKEDKQ